MIAEIPVVKCRREGVHLVFVEPCPYCGKKHLHGVGDGGGGHRVSHCVPKPPRRPWERPRPIPGADKGYILKVIE